MALNHWTQSKQANTNRLDLGQTVHTGNRRKKAQLSWLTSLPLFFRSYTARVSLQVLHGTIGHDERLYSLPASFPEGTHFQGRHENVDIFQCATACMDYLITASPIQYSLLTNVDDVTILIKHDVAIVPILDL